MSMPRKLGIAFCVLGLIAVCILALVLPSATRGFAGLAGIQSDLADEAQLVVGDYAPESIITVTGRVVSVDLPETVPAGFDASALRRDLKNIDGVRSVTLRGDPQIALDPEDRPDPVPTMPPETVAEPTPVPEPTVEPTTPPARPLDQVVAEFDLSGVTFEPGSPDLTPDGRAQLDAVAEQLRGASGGPVQVQVHTDNTGDPDVNLLLSQDRAEEVADYLIDSGVDAALLEPRGFGASNPIADNSTEQGRTANQRVEFVVEGN